MLSLNFEHCSKVRLNVGLKVLFSLRFRTYAFTAYGLISRLRSIVGKCAMGRRMGFP